MPKLEMALLAESRSDRLADSLRYRLSAVDWSKPPPPPPEGWTRTFVLAGDGWIKDGDYNTTFSETVRPLPLHDQPDYSTPPTTLEDDPAYQRHPEDWRTYHTRYVAPDRFHRAMRPQPAQDRDR